MPREIKDMIQSKSCIKFNPRLREIDRQYEVNNNAELDNGVYHEFAKDEKKQGSPEREDSLLSDFTDSQRENGGKKTDLQLLERMMNKEQKLNVSGGLQPLEEYKDEHATQK